MRSRAALGRQSRLFLLYVFISLGALGLAATLAVGWAYEYNPDSGVRNRVQEAWSQVRDMIAPVPDTAPTPVQAAAAPTFAPPPLPATSTQAAPTPTAWASATASFGASSTPPSSATVPPPTATALPTTVALSGFRHEYQLLNNCGPASLAMTLSYWGWDGNQKDTARVLKPIQDDKNVSPREMYEYLLTQGFDAYIRVNGDVETLKRLMAAGYPVLVEKGFVCLQGERCRDWFGHYSVFAGYDDSEQVFILQDSYRGPGIKMAYADVVANWRAFNYLYVVVFPAGEARDAEVRALLGESANLDRNYRDALARAQEEALTSTGQDAAFAWFNVGTNLHNLQDYAGAAAAYDQARQIGLPYRMLWYQFGPYRSYYQMARYQDVVALATFAINSIAPGVVPGLEEAYFWRGQAEVSMGLRDEATADFRTALERHPGYQPALDALAELGVTP